jgi:hypothetical protein
LRPHLLLAPLAGVLVACGGGDPWPADAERYIPPFVGDVEVDGSSPFAASLAQSVAGTADVEAATGAVGRPTAEDPAPQQVVLVLGGDDDEVGRALERLEGELLAGAAAADAGSEGSIEGVTVSSGTVEQGERPLGFAQAQPRDDLLVVVLAFDGGPEAARSALGEALRSART